MKDRNLVSFDSRGHLTQIDYAKRYVSLSNTLLGMNTSNGSVILLNNSSSKLGNFIDSNIYIINKFICISGTGMFADLKVIIKRARKDAMTFYYNFGEKISTHYLIKKLSFFIQEYTQQSGVRPFGTSILIIGCDENGPCLYRINPGGTYSKNYLCGFGENSIECLQFLEKRWNKNFNTKDSIDLGIRCLKEISDIKTTSENIQIAFLSRNNEIKIFGKKRIQNSIEAIFSPERIFERFLSNYILDFLRS